MTPTPDRDTLRIAQRALGACLLFWPAMVEALGEDRAARRVDAWAARVVAIREQMQ